MEGANAVGALKKWIWGPGRRVPPLRRNANGVAPTRGRDRDTARHSAAGETSPAPFRELFCPFHRANFCPPIAARCVPQLLQLMKRENRSHHLQSGSESRQHSHRLPAFLSTLLRQQSVQILPAKIFARQPLPASATRSPARCHRRWSE